MSQILRLCLHTGVGLCGGSGVGSLLALVAKPKIIVLIIGSIFNIKKKINIKTSKYYQAKKAELHIGYYYLLPFPALFFRLPGMLFLQGPLSVVV